VTPHALLSGVRVPGGGVTEHWLHAVVVSADAVSEVNRIVFENERILVPRGELGKTKPGWMIAGKQKNGSSFTKRALQPQ